MPGKAQPLAIRQPRGQLVGHLRIKRVHGRHRAIRKTGQHDAARVDLGPRGEKAEPGIGVGQLTGTPCISARLAGSGHGSLSRVQFTATAMTGTARTRSSAARKGERNRPQRKWANGYSVFLNTAW